MALPSKLTEADRARIAVAVASAEAGSAGEIVTILADRSDDYADVALAWSALAGLLALAALTIAPGFYLNLYDAITGGWVHDRTPREVFAVALTVVTLKFAGTWLLLLWPPLRLLLVPGRIKSARTRMRAVACFKVGAERRTRGRTGILIYLSMREHRAEIVADAAIAGTVAPELWGDAMAAMLVHIREGRVADGLIAAVERVGAVLAEHVPRGAQDVNELPDRLIEV